MKKRLGYVSAIAMTILLGLMSRSGDPSLPAWIAEHAGDACWAACVYWGIRLIWPGGSIVQGAGIAWVIAIMVECGQLWQAPWLNEIRQTRLGSLLLGHGFLWSDWVRYGAGVVGAGGLDALIRSPKTKQSAIFAGLAIGFTIAATQVGSNTLEIITKLGLVWIALVCLFFSLAYLQPQKSTKWLGKQADGQQSWPVKILLAPYLVPNALVFSLYRKIHRQPPFHQVAPNLFLGRRLTTTELQRLRPQGWFAVLDATWEFAEIPAFRQAPKFLAVPLLDQTAPSASVLQDTVAWLRESVQQGPTYVHCALGHGRSATLLLAYWLADQVVSTIQEGEQRLQAIRPRVRLADRQREALRDASVKGEKEKGRSLTEQ